MRVSKNGDLSERIEDRSSRFRVAITSITAAAFLFIVARDWWSPDPSTPKATVPDTSFSRPVFVLLLGVIVFCAGAAFLRGFFEGRLSLVVGWLLVLACVGQVALIVEAEREELAFSTWGESGLAVGAFMCLLGALTVRRRRAHLRRGR